MYSDLHEVKIDSECTEILRMLSNSNEQMEKTNTAEIRWLICALKPKKSTDFDQISNFMIKRIPASYIERFANRFNQWLSVSEQRRYSFATSITCVTLGIFLLFFSFLFFFLHMTYISGFSTSFFMCHLFICIMCHGIYPHHPMETS